MGLHVVIAGGRGLVDAVGLSLLCELADLLHAEIVGTRGAVEAGWLSKDTEVGMSGKNVVCDVYIAFGVSGSHFHIVGVKGNPLMVGVNTNPHARIHELSDISVVEDAQTVLRRMIAYFSRCENSKLPTTREGMAEAIRESLV